ncbi:hypothetical protein SRHO_G00000550 [Serrasalmus rhombeus]
MVRVEPERGARKEGRIFISLRKAEAGEQSRTKRYVITIKSGRHGDDLLVSSLHKMSSGRGPHPVSQVAATIMSADYAEICTSPSLEVSKPSIYRLHWQRVIKPAFAADASTTNSALPQRFDSQSNGKSRRWLLKSNRNARKTATRSVSEGRSRGGQERRVQQIQDAVRTLLCSERPQRGTPAFQPRCLTFRFHIFTAGLMCECGRRTALN